MTKSNKKCVAWYEYMSEMLLTSSLSWNFMNHDLGKTSRLTETLADEEEEGYSAVRMHAKA